MTGAVPRWVGAEMSPRTPPVLVTGAEPKESVKTPVISVVRVFLTVAVLNEKTAGKEVRYEDCWLAAKYFAHWSPR